MTISNSVFKVIGDGVLNQDIVDASSEIIAANTIEETIKAVKKYKNLVLISARLEDIKKKGAF
jgi:hypothetical protein